MRRCYINICCNLAGQTHPSFAAIPVPFSITPKHTNPVRISCPADQLPCRKQAHTVLTHEQLPSYNCSSQPVHGYDMLSIQCMRCYAQHCIRGPALWSNADGNV